MTVLSRSKNAALRPTGRKCSRKEAVAVVPGAPGGTAVTGCEIRQTGSTLAPCHNRYSTCAPFVRHASAVAIGIHVVRSHDFTIGFHHLTLGGCAPRDHRADSARPPRSRILGRPPSPPTGVVPYGGPTRPNAPGSGALRTPKHAVSERRHRSRRTNRPSGNRGTADRLPAWRSDRRAGRAVRPWPPTWIAGGSGGAGMCGLCGWCRVGRTGEGYRTTTKLNGTAQRSPMLWIFHST